MAKTEHNQKSGGRKGPGTLQGIGDVVPGKRPASGDATWKWHHWTRGPDFSTEGPQHEA